ncbi:MAG: phage tail tape measure C-terminal domain-containing protein [Pseudomonadota bacterium]
MADDKELLIRIRADIRQSLAELKRVSEEINKTGTTSAKSAGQVKKLGNEMAGLKSIATTIFTAATVRALVSNIVEYERLSAVMKTLTGDSRVAAAEMDKLKEFAATTPFDLKAVIEAFARLQSVGLDPSTESLRSYGNTAAAMGRDLMQFVEAVADATTGEFERLKDFGIKASAEGNKVRFTFRGVTTEVSKDAREIETYLRGIGDTDFSTGMSEQMDTLGGEFRKLKGELFTLSAEIGKAGLSEFLKDVARQAINASKWVIKFNEALDFLEERLGTRIMDPRQLSEDALGARIELLKDQIAAKERSIEFAPGGELNGEMPRMRESLQELQLRLAELEQERNERRNTPALERPAGGDGGGPTQEQEAARKAAERAAKTREDAVRSLEFEAQTYGLTREAIALYRLELDGASQAQMDRARTALESISADEDFEAAVRASEEAVRAENEAYHDWLDTLKGEAQQVYDSTRTKQEKLTAAVERYRLMLNQGVIDQQTFDRAVAKAQGDFDKFEADGTDAFEALTDAVHGWGKEFNDTLTDMVMTGKFQFGDLVDSMIRDLLRLSLYKGVTEPLFDIFKSFLPAVNTGVAAASGGYISGPGTATSDSIPARLSNGEYVVRASAVRAYGASFLEAINQMRLPRFAHVPNLSITRPGHRFAEGGLAEPLGAGGGIGSLKVQIDNKGTQIRATEAQASFDPDGLVVRIVTEDVRRGGPMSGVLERTFGLRRKGGF